MQLCPSPGTCKYKKVQQSTRPGLPCALPATDLAYTTPSSFLAVVRKYERWSPSDRISALTTSPGRKHAYMSTCRPFPGLVGLINRTFGHCLAGCTPRLSAILHMCIGACKCVCVCMGMCVIVTHVQAPARMHATFGGMLMRKGAHCCVHTLR